MPGIIIAVVVGLLVLILIGIYNRLVRLRNRTDNAWAQVDVQLKRRYDLIPNLVETVKGYAAHEQQTFERVIQARNVAQAAQGPADQAQAENFLTGALRQLFALAEAYPELQASENFRGLQQELSDTEDRIAVSRQIYNDTVLSYNNRVQQVPTNFVASIFSFGIRVLRRRRRGQGSPAVSSDLETPDQAAGHHHWWCCRSPRRRQVLSHLGCRHHGGRDGRQLLLITGASPDFSGSCSACQDIPLRVGESFELVSVGDELITYGPGGCLAGLHLRRTFGLDERPGLAQWSGITRLRTSADLRARIAWWPGQRVRRCRGSRLRCGGSVGGPGRR
jgi:LemA protein